MCEIPVVDGNSLREGLVWGSVGHLTESPPIPLVWFTNKLYVCFLNSEKISQDISSLRNTVLKCSATSESVLELRIWIIRYDMPHNYGFTI